MLNVTPKTIYLIDGYAQFFRAYHAIRTPMTSPVTMEPTNLTFGFVGMLLKLLRGEGTNLGGKPDYVAVALDVSGDRGTFRTQLYPQYKANRPPPPDDLRPQVDRCLALLKAIGVPVIGVEGFEADDVIAALVEKFRASEPGLRVRIISKDKDFKQLLREGGDGGASVEMYDIHKDEVIDVAALRADLGLRPDQIVDMLTLMGDTSDNVPGVEGVGAKTAARLLIEFGTLDALMARADEIKGNRGEKLREAADRLELSRELVTLRTDIDVPLDLADASAAEFGLSALIPILKELGFNRYQDDVRAMIGVEASTPVNRPAQAAIGTLFSSLHEPASIAQGDYTCVRTKDELDAMLAQIEAAPVVAVDTETTGLRPMQCKLCGLSFAVKAGSAWYVPVRSPEPASHLDETTVLEALRHMLEDESKPKVGHNLKYDLLVLRNHGVELRGFTRTKGGMDTMVASYLIDASRSSHSLDALSLALLGRQNVSIKELIGRGKSQKTFDQVPLEQASPYAAEDADVSLQIAAILEPQLEAMGLDGLARDLELPLVEVLAELEWNGIQVEPNELDRQRERLDVRIVELREQIQTASMESVGRGFDVDSPKQLSGILFNDPEAADPGLGIKPIKKTKTGFSTDVEVLDKLDANPLVETPIPKLVLEYRQLTKLVNTYLVALKDAINPNTRRIHASFNQTVAVTGRLSSSDPNLQNIPIRTDVGREIRKAFVAPPGRVLVSADYSQIELRLLAHLSGDPNLIEAFRSGQDIHAKVAAQVYGVRLQDVTREQRGGAKMVNFGIIYGITPFGLARRLDISNTEAGEIIAGYKERFAGIKTFLEECAQQAREKGYVETMLKRRRPIPDIESNNPQRRALAERMAINSVVQGSAADLIKIAMIDLHGRLSEHAASWRAGKEPEIADVKMLLQIHDELVFEAPEVSAEAVKTLVVERMESAMALSVPLVADASIASNWYDGK